MRATPITPSSWEGMRKEAPRPPVITIVREKPPPPPVRGACPFCHAQFADAFRFCPACGKQLTT